MISTVFTTLGQQLLTARRKRGMNQPDLAKRLGRDRARISELERDLAANRLGRDRLTLFAEMCEALDLVPVLIPKARVAELRPLIEENPAIRHSAEAPSAFEELFIDLDDDEPEDQ